MPNHTDSIKCPHCDKTFTIQVEIEGSGDDTYATVTALEKNICPRCKGYGWVDDAYQYSDSTDKFPTRIVATCPECKGKGFIEVNE
jgi:DnaJ-class molecular chaperone